jgi:uncharacterized protein YukJ
MSQAKFFERERRWPRQAGVTTYGVLVGAIKGGQFDSGRSPHYGIWVEGGGQDFRAAVNVQSVDGSEVLAFSNTNYTTTSPALDLAGLAAGPQGFAPLQTGPGGNGLDYLRDHLFDIDAMQAIPDAGSSGSLDTLLDAQVRRAKADSRAVAIVFGDFFQDAGEADEDFGFSPEQGVHDIHMMQGNSGSFEKDNTSNGDGALFIRFAGGQTFALFIRFVTQGTETDGQGNPTAADP